MAESTNDPIAPEPLPAAEMALLAAYRGERRMPPEVRRRLVKRAVAQGAAPDRRPLLVGLAVAGALAAAVLLAIGVASSGFMGTTAHHEDAGSQAPMQRQGHAAHPTVPRTSTPTRASTPAPTVDAAVVAPPDPIAAPQVTPDDASAPPAPSAKGPARARPAQTRPSSPDEPAVDPAPTGPSSIVQERQLLTRAWGALSSGEHAKALEQAQSHARRFPTGMLAVERDAIATIAGCHVQRPGWSAKAQAFLATHGKTPSARRVRQACTEIQDPPEKVTSD